MILDEFGKPINPPANLQRRAVVGDPRPEKPALTLIRGDDRPDVEFSIETRESRIEGYSHWAVLRYKTHVFEELLPQTVMAWDEQSRDMFMLPVMQRLQLKLKPVIVEEDAPQHEVQI